MPNRYVLLISDKENGFTVNALFEAIKNAGTEVHSLSISDENLLGSIDSSSVVFIVDSCQNTTLLQAIKVKCADADKRVILYGDNDAISEMKRVFSDTSIIREFIRPCEIDDVVSELLKIIKNINHLSTSKKILVVDDSGVMLRTIMGWLEGKYEVSLANSAASAIMAIQKSRPDLILLDYEMPVCSGAQFMEMLSREDETKDIPIMFLTSRSDAQTVKEVMELKPKGYILKTTPQSQLISKIEAYFNSLK